MLYEGLIDYGIFSAHILEKCASKGVTGSNRGQIMWLVTDQEWRIGADDNWDYMRLGKSQ